MEILHWLSGPVIGAVIGYFTNYLAVKMLFHPYYPVKLGSFVLPFTPGIIPKRRGHLARALGQVVGNELLTGEDLKGLLLSEDMESRVADGVVNGLSSSDYGNLHQVAGHFMEEESYQEKKRLFCRQISEMLGREINRMDISSIIVREGTKVVQEKTRGTMFEMFLNDKVIASIAGPIGECVSDYIKEHGQEMTEPAVINKVEDYTEKPFTKMLADWQISEEQVKKAVQTAYHRVVDSQLERAVQEVNVAAIVEEKINGMELPELEKLLLSVMKKELSALVSLGAVIGFVIGIINCFL